MENSDIVVFNVGGSIFATTRSTILRDPDSMLATMISGHFDSKRDAQGNYFIDFDGSAFGDMLNFLRCSSDFKYFAALTLLILVPPPLPLFRDDNMFVFPESQTQLRKLLHTANYFQVTGLISLIAQFTVNTNNPLQELVSVDNPFSGRDLSSLNLSGLSLVQLDLSHCNLSNANLRKVNLSKAKLCHADLTNTKLSESLLDNADFTSAILDGANLLGSSLCGAVFIKCKMQKSNLTTCIATGANFADCDFTQACLQSAVFDESNLTKALLNNANLTGTSFNKTCLAGAVLVGAKAEDTKFTDANLTGASMEAVNVRGCVFGCAVFEGANLNLTSGSCAAISVQG
eukprot:c12432_g1_i3.p1 GENE.c12432_g1_i3~~c12432_g1_i3.p1  ORF type:complete len:345 (+),score=68.81 c12432_g1_i3:152-1186(+)